MILNNSIFNLLKGDYRIFSSKYWRLSCSGLHSISFTLRLVENPNALVGALDPC